MASCFFVLISAQQTTAQLPDSLRVVKPGAVLTQVSKQFAFTEGPAVDKAGNIFFTDQPNDKIWEYDTAGKLSLFMDKTHRANGMYFTAAGMLVACADEAGQLLAIDRNKKMVPLLSSIDGHVMNGPNDLWINRRGDIYFTDPYYQRDYWTRKKPDLEKQNVYLLLKGKKNALVLDSTLQQPNGIVGTADGKWLYVADIRAGKTYKYSIGKDGELHDRQLFAPMGSDGMTLDEEGNLYLTGKGITIFNAAGVRLGNIPVPEGWTANLCFGGRDLHTLFITASTAVYTLQMTVRGVE